MKKIICFLLILSFSLLWVGCHNTPVDPNENEEQQGNLPGSNSGEQLPDLPPEDVIDPTISNKLLYDLDLDLSLTPYDGFFSCRGPEDRLIQGKVTVSATYKNFSVVSIWMGAFAGCKNLTEVVLQEGIEIIHDQSFTFATGLQKLTLPVTIVSIGMEAFAGCSSLTEITFQGTKAQWGAIEKGENWAAYITNCVIRCHDGNIQLTATPAQ